MQLILLVLSDDYFIFLLGYTMLEETHNYMDRWKKVLMAQSCLTLCDPMGYRLPRSSVQEILQAKILEWVAIPFSRGSSRARDQTWVFCIAGRFFTIWASREACTLHSCCLFILYIIVCVSFHTPISPLLPPFSPLITTSLLSISVCSCFAIYFHLICFTYKW